jgi:hypothetical protein
MTNRRAWLLQSGVVFLLVVGLPLAGKWLRRQDGPRCAVDGLLIDPLYRVRVIDSAGHSYSFCCVRCAQRWWRRHADEQTEAFATDETTATEIPANQAYFVDSNVITNPVTNNSIHVFRRRADAEEHAKTFAGEVLTEAERPFTVEKRSP